MQKVASHSASSTPTTGGVSCSGDRLSRLERVQLILSFSHHAVARFGYLVPHPWEVAERLRDYHPSREPAAHRLLLSYRRSTSGRSLRLTSQGIGVPAVSLRSSLGAHLRTISNAVPRDLPKVDVIFCGRKGHQAKAPEQRCRGSAIGRGTSPALSVHPRV